MDATLLKKSYDILSDVLRKDAYLNIALKDIGHDPDKAVVTKIAYGTVEHYYKIDAIIKSLARSVKPAIKVVLAQAIYAILYLEIPNYAIVNASVDLTETIGKRELKGFVNAVLKKVATGNFTLPEPGTPARAEADYNLPYDVIKRIEHDLKDNAKKVLRPEHYAGEHVRLRTGYSHKLFMSQVPTAVKSKAGGYFVKLDDTVSALSESGKLTVQSPSSMMAVQALGDVKDKELLDLCSAPGGKAVYSAELGARVTACDLYAKRLNLVSAYARRMGVKLTLKQNDAKVYRAEWESKFDIVTVDAPCSGIGVIGKRPDIALRVKATDFDSLSKEQSAILETASRYVKKGGILLYSTCTVIPAENGDVVRKFLSTHTDFTFDEGKDFPAETSLYPSSETDGFYIARLKRL